MRLPIALAAGLATLVVAGPADAATVTKTFTGVNEHEMLASPAGGFPVPDNGMTVATMPGGAYGDVVSVASIGLKSLSHTNPDDLDVKVVSPSGGQSILMSDAGGTEDLTDRKIAFREDAALMPNAGPLGAALSFAPTNYGAGDTWGPDCGPDVPPTTFAGLAGPVADPDATWRLCLRDDAAIDTGKITGWTIEAATTGFKLPGWGTDGVASAYPGKAAVDGSLPGPVSKVRVTLHELDAERVGELDVLLVSPSGTGVTLLSDAGGDGAFDGDLTFDQAAPPLTSTGDGSSLTVRPTDHDADFDDTFPNAPKSPRSESLDAFAGESGQGEWKLYALDDKGAGGVATVGGWSLELTTGTPDTAAAPAPAATSPAAPASPPASRAVPARSPAKLALGRLRPTVKRGRVRVKFTLSAPARTTIEVERRTGKRFTRVTSTTVDGRRGGNTVALKRTLRPGAYRMTVRAGAAKRTATFRVKGGR